MIGITNRTCPKWITHPSALLRNAVWREKRLELWDYPFEFCPPKTKILINENDQFPLALLFVRLKDHVWWVHSTVTCVLRLKLIHIFKPAWLGPLLTRGPTPTRRDGLARGESKRQAASHSFSVVLFLLRCLDQPLHLTCLCGPPPPLSLVLGDRVERWRRSD